MPSNDRSLRWTTPLVLLALLALWQLGVVTGRIHALFFPAPTTIARTFIEQLAEGPLLTMIGITLARILAGFLIGGVVGLLLGLALGLSAKLRIVIDPLIAAIHPVPKISILPLILIIFGIGETSKVVIIALTAFFPLVINTMAGVRQIHPLHLDAARHYGARGRKLFQRVILPGSLPLILSGVRLALNSAFIVTIAVELLTAQVGLGAMIWLAWETLRTDDLYVAIFTISLLGIGFNLLLRRLELYLLHWQDG